MTRKAVAALVLWSAVFVSAQEPPREPAPSTAVAATLTGTWRIDRKPVQTAHAVWKRRVDALEVAPAGDVITQAKIQLANPMSAAPVGAYSPLEIADLRSAMRDLLETAESLDFAFASRAVTITDDLKRALEFTVD